MGALDGLRILDCGDFVAAPFATLMLGHLGADVVKVEPPAGDSNRRRGPFARADNQRETGALHLYLDQTKRGVVLDLDTDAGRAELARLAAGADAAIASGLPDDLRRRGLTFAALRQANPSLIVTTITPFGLDDSRGTPAMREICDMAASGWLGLAPGALEDPALPPLKPFGQQAHYQAGLHAALTTLAALWEQRASGVGQQIDIAVQAAVASQIEIALSHFLYGGRVASRLGSRILGPWGVVQLTDGLLFIVAVTEDEWKRLVAFLGNPDWASSELFADRLLRATNNDALLPLIEGEFAGRGVQETFTALQEARIPCAPVSEMASLLTSPHLQARSAFSVTDHPLAGRWTYPGAPYKLSATPWAAGRAATVLGAEHAAAIAQSWPPRPQRTAAARRDLPLAGVRVADFTWVWAGPLATMQLAHLGADVIRVESSSRPDTVRGIPPFWGEQPGPNRSGYFNQYNQGKRSILLNLKTTEGLELAHDLVRQADVVCDNFSGGAMARLGLGFDDLHRIKPGIIQVSMSGLGQDGPFARYVAYGPTQVPTIGLASLTGYPGGGPREAGISYGDPNAGLNAAIAILAALHHRARTGEGQYIDMSQWEAAIPLVVEGLLTYEMTGQQPLRMGNRDQWEAPQGVFRCSGIDDWIAVSCWSDAEWQGLAAAIGRPDLAADPALASRAGRKAREEELEQAIGAWTATRPRDEAARALCGAGVPAQAVLTTADVANDPALAERGFWTELAHPEAQGARHAGIPWRFSGTPLAVSRAAPCVGEHTDEVLSDLLARDAATIAQLRAAGVLA